MHKVLRFLLAGSITYVIGIGLTYVLKEAAFLSSNISYLISLTCITIINFVLTLCFTFKKSYNHTIFGKYIITLLSFSIFNYIITIFMKNMFGEQYLYIIIFIVTSCLWFGKFVIYDRLVFNKSNI